MNILWIGTGVMGTPMLTHLSQHHQVTAFNRSKDKLKLLPSQIIIKPTLLEAIANQEVIITMLGFPQDVETVYQTLLDHVKPGTILIDFTTSSPSLATKLWQWGKTKGIALLDAPVTGGLKGAQQQSLTIMVGGDHDTFKKAEPIFSLLGKTILYMGNAGQGQTAKMANQIAIAGQLAGLAEALSFAKHKQLDLPSILTMLGTGAAQSYSVTHYGPKMLQADWQATFYIKHFLKDLRIAIAYSNRPLPITLAVETLLSSLIDEYGEKGVQAIIQAYLK
jgi:3-hydroxyisobutyrate dehydrogenase